MDENKTYSMPRGRLVLGNRLVVAALVLCIPGMLLQGLGMAFVWVVLGLALVLSVVGIVVTDRTRVCPQCTKRLDKVAFKRGVPPRGGAILCPHCQAHIDIT